MSCPRRVPPERLLRQTVQVSKLNRVVSPRAKITHRCTYFYQKEDESKSQGRCSKLSCFIPSICCCCCTHELCCCVASIQRESECVCLHSRRHQYMYLYKPKTSLIPLPTIHGTSCGHHMSNAVQCIAICTAFTGQTISKSTQFNTFFF